MSLVLGRWLLLDFFLFTPVTLIILYVFIVAITFSLLNKLTFLNIDSLIWFLALRWILAHSNEVALHIVCDFQFLLLDAALVKKAVGFDEQDIDFRLIQDLTFGEGSNYLLVSSCLESGFVRS
jgi:hypothetical protein